MKSQELVMRIKTNLDQSEKNMKELLESLEKKKTKESSRLKTEMYKNMSEHNRKIIDNLLEILSESILEDKDEHTNKFFK